MPVPSLVWLRQDLRLDDQPAIAAAASQGPFAAVYVLDDETPGAWSMGAAQHWWLHHSLASLADRFQELGGALILRKGPAALVVAEVAKELGASTIHATRHYEPWWRAEEEKLGPSLQVHAADTLVPLEAVRTGAGKPYRIYSPFCRAAAQIEVAEPVAAPARIARPGKLPKSERLGDWNLRPTAPNWAKGFAIWKPGEGGAADRLSEFEEVVGEYATDRDMPSLDGTSMLSPHLHFGEISPRRVWHALHKKRAAAKFLKELAWRDFSRSAMLGDPEIGDRSQRDIKIKWREGARANADFRAWTKGRTGYPIVDAGMRQLWATGWMHNRVRMIAASFLTKHLLIDWRRGERWFWDTLVDADYGNNSLNWQWIAGTGVDSQLFNRIMAPLTQSAKFKAADYIREWVPELEHLADDQIHDPADRGDYPDPLIGHQEARERALGALKAARSA